MKIVTILIFSAISMASYCQTGNLVPNPSFDETKGKIKAKGQVNIATGWISATEDNADLYSKNSKLPDFATPGNLYGEETPNEGDNYAGIVAQSLKNSVPRTYLQTELTQPLEAGKFYCVQFMISLADIAKFACNDIGVHLSATRITSVEILKYSVKPQILHSKNKVYENQDFWEPVCGVYKAEGGENIITIGNFAQGTDAELTKMKRPKGFTKPQQNTAYYYVENVSVISLEEVAECICEKEAKKEVMNIVYTKNVSTLEKEGSAGTHKQIEYKKVFFDFKSAGISIDAGKELTSVVKLMQDNPAVKVEILGNTDVQEQANSDLATLSEDRAKNVFYYLTSKGIKEARLSYKGMGNTKPMSKGSAQNDRAQNRRVEFVIVEGK